MVTSGSAVRDNGHRPLCRDPCLGIPPAVHGVPAVAVCFGLTTLPGALIAACAAVALAMSAAVLIPCVWHRRIEAGDLGSHVYNAWLAQLTEKGQAPGLYIARQWDNILFDVLLLGLAKAAGFAAAQRIAVSLCVLVFFWGVFALVSAVT